MRSILVANRRHVYRYPKRVWAKAPRRSIAVCPTGQSSVLSMFSHNLCPPHLRLKPRHTIIYTAVHNIRDLTFHVQKSFPLTRVQEWTFWSQRRQGWLYCCAVPGLDVLIWSHNGKQQSLGETYAHINEFKSLHHSLNVHSHNSQTNT